MAFGIRSEHLDPHFDVDTDETEHEIAVATIVTADGKVTGEYPFATWEAAREFRAGLQEGWGAIVGPNGERVRIQWARAADYEEL